jgi:hypothetical protein
MGWCLVAWTVRDAAQDHSFHTQGNRAAVATFEQITMAM